MLGILLLCLVHVAISQTPIRQYVVDQDFFLNFKPSQYSIYDQTGQNIMYRIESKYSFLHSLELVDYATKNVIGKLQSKMAFIYVADLEIYDSRTQQWLNGTINRNWKWLGYSFKIQINNHSLLMESKTASLTTHIYDEKHNHLPLVKSKLRAPSLPWVHQYNIEIYSDEVPDSVYLLSLAAKFRVSQSRKGR